MMTALLIYGLVELCAVIAFLAFCVAIELAPAQPPQEVPDRD